MIDRYDSRSVSQNAVNDEVMKNDPGGWLMRYHNFILTLWQDGEPQANAPPVWRFSLEYPSTGERHGFKHTDELLRFIHQWTDGPSSGGFPFEELSDSRFSKTAYRGGSSMERQIINPWTWQDEFGYVQANLVSGAQRTLYCSGQAANDASGAAVLAGDIRGQIGLALDNLETVLSAAGFSFADIVRLNIFTTDVDQFFANYDAFIGRLAEAGCRHTGSLIGVARLAFPEMMVEIEATAVA